MESTFLCNCCFNKKGIQVFAANLCKSCGVGFCQSCTDIHKRNRATQNHKLKSTDVNRSVFKINLQDKLLSKTVLCTAECGNCGKLEVESFCLTCHQILCYSCLEKHQINHEFVKKEIKDKVTLQLCFGCRQNGIVEVSEKLCCGCIEYYCRSCCNIHVCRNFTSNKETALNTPNCEPCEMTTIYTPAKNICSICNEFLCAKCSLYHKFSKHSKNHVLLTISKHKADRLYQTNCEPCRFGEKIVTATKICHNCDELLCESCVAHHSRYKSTKRHVILTFVPNVKFWENKNVQTNSVCTADQETETCTHEISKMPGKPEATYIGIDSVKLRWVGVMNLEDDEYYQVCFREVNNGPWTFSPEQNKSPATCIINLKGSTAYVFRVKVICENDDGHYSPSSDKIFTLQPSAALLVNLSRKIIHVDEIPSPSLCTVPLEENLLAYNFKAKVRKFDIGPRILDKTCQEKTIILIGVSGSGKATLVDGMINYILGVRWNDPFRFTVRFPDEKENKSHLSVWMNCFSINLIPGSRLPYRLNILDIPSFELKNGFERNNDILQQLRCLLSQEESYGMHLVDAICFVVKASDPELTGYQNHMFLSVLSLLETSLQPNINVLYTFADCSNALLLSKGLNMGIPIPNSFSFNNSALFARNSDSCIEGISRMFWDFGFQLFEKFFEHLNKVEVKELRLTKDMLKHIFEKESVIEEMNRVISFILRNIKDLRIKQKAVEDSEVTILTNVQFETELDEVVREKEELPNGHYAVNCSICIQTCKRGLAVSGIDIANEIDVNCSICSKKCSASSHSAEYCAYNDVNVKKITIDEEKKQAHAKAVEELEIHDSNVQELSRTIKRALNKLEKQKETLNKHQQLIKELSCCPEPPNMLDEIELAIEAAKLERQEGYTKKIDKLVSCKRFVEIKYNIDDFIKKTKLMLNSVGKYRFDNQSSRAHLLSLTEMFEQCEREIIN